MSTHNICFRGEIRKYLPDTHSYLDLSPSLKSGMSIVPNRSNRQNAKPKWQTIIDADDLFC